VSFLTEAPAARTSAARTEGEPRDGPEALPSQGVDDSGSTRDSLSPRRAARTDQGEFNRAGVKRARPAIALIHVPRDDFRLFEPFAEIGKYELAHGCFPCLS